MKGVEGMQIFQFLCRFFPWWGLLPFLPLHLCISTFLFARPLLTSQPIVYSLPPKHKSLLINLGFTHLEFVRLQCPPHCSHAPPRKKRYAGKLWSSHTGGRSCMTLGHCTYLLTPAPETPYHPRGVSFVALEKPNFGSVLKILFNTYCLLMNYSSASFCSLSGWNDFSLRLFENDLSFIMRSSFLLPFPHAVVIL